MKSNLTILLLFLAFFQLKAEVRLPQFFSDHMVLQRNQEVKIWGWADRNERVTVSFNGQTLKTKADRDGKWEVVLKEMKASFQPLEMTVKGKNEIILKNILIGDVWICSGQSNMEWPVASSNSFEEEVKNAKYPNIRLFDVPRQIEFKPANDTQEAKWKTAEGDNISRFSAVGYFFGRHIHKNHNVPIGLISSNWGGTRAEAWTSVEELTPFEYTKESIKQMQDLKLTLAEIREEERKALDTWIMDYYPQNDIGDTEKWYANEYDFSDWKGIFIPSPIEEQEGLEDFDGVVWFKKKFILSPALADKDLYLRLGTIKQIEKIYLNGVEVIDNKNPKLWRSHLISKEFFKNDGENIITIKLFNSSGEGGLVEVNKAKIAISPTPWQITEYDVLLANEWKYKVSATLEVPVTTPIPEIKKYQPNKYPSSLFNGMINPLIPMAIKGVIWYQGESNANTFEHSIRYNKVFSTMIKDWRKRWGYDFDFYFVQLANYWSKQPPCGDQPCEQAWAYVRESQLKTLSLPNTGMAVIIDAGEAKDIHPRNKQIVGKRLGLIADAKTYGKTEVVYSGPAYQSHEVKGNEVWLNFEHLGSGLVARNKYGYLQGFQVAGKDKVFHWASARIENGKVVVTSEKVSQPVAVRYAWENNPEDANLYNQEGLPASPFRTDDWDYKELMKN